MGICKRKGKSFKEENNGFNTIDDIKNVSRIGDKTFEKFKDKIIV